MNSASGWLPPLLPTEGDRNDLIERLFTVFRRDIEFGKLVHDGLVVEWDNRVLPEGKGKPEMFWHLIQCYQKRGDDGVFDPFRARRLAWVRPIIMLTEKDVITSFDYFEPKRVIRRYLWVRSERYRVILQKILSRDGPPVFILISGHFIDHDRANDQMLEKYENRIR